MRQILPLASIVFLFTGCTTYQYMTVNGTNISTNERSEFVMENDSFRVKYNFSGADAPVNVEIQNKLDKPLYIDWRRSALIVHDKAISYVPASVPVSGSINASTWSSGNRVFNSTTTSGSFSGSVAVPEDMEFIPPGTYKSKVPLGVTNVFYEDAREKAKKLEIQLATDVNGTVLTKSYADSSSPLQFSSYLTMYTEGSFDKPVVLQHSFYVSEIWTTTIPPHNFRFANDKMGNRFYVSRINGFGKFAGGFGLVAGAALVTYAEVKTAEKYGRNNYRHRY